MKYRRFSWIVLRQSKGVVWLISSQEEELLMVIQLHFKASNNKAEYEALLAGLQTTM